jgi:hypothetical protein
MGGERAEEEGGKREREEKREGGRGRILILGFRSQEQRHKTHTSGVTNIVESI